MEGGGTRMEVGKGWLAKKWVVVGLTWNRNGEDEKEMRDE